MKREETLDRVLNILAYLLKANGPKNIQEIAKTLGYSKKFVRAYLARLCYDRIVTQTTEDFSCPFESEGFNIDPQSVD